MNLNSKQLSNQDVSGEEFSNTFFKNPQFSHLLIDFDRIHYDFKKESWFIVDHILIEKNYSSFQELPINVQEKIINLNNFTEFFKEKTTENVSLVVDLYFPKEHQNNAVIIVNDDFSFTKTSLKNYAQKFRETNFYGTVNNRNKSFYEESKYSSQEINQNREDNSAFSLSKACLCKNVTYGFNTDKIIFDNNRKTVYILEYLLCDETQKVTPYSSHPNRYFRKNSQKFINLFKLSKKLDSPLYLINYAKKGTTHDNQILFMNVLGINENQQTPVVTEDIKFTKDDFYDFLVEKLLANEYRNKPISKM